MLILAFTCGIVIGLMAGARFPKIFRSFSRGAVLMAHYFIKIVKPFKITDA